MSDSEEHNKLQATNGPSSEKINIANIPSRATTNSTNSWQVKKLHVSFELIFHSTEYPF